MEMTTVWKSAVAGLAAALMLACGGGGSLPPTGPGSSGTPVAPADPVENPSEALWPLSAGSRWVYRITDERRGVFEKVVDVLGEEVVPGSAANGIHVRSLQPHLEEHSWQAVADGLVVRLREDDMKEGALVRSTTWNPANVKAIAGEVDGAWTHGSVVMERTTLPDGTSEEKERTYNWRVLGTGVRVETPAGVFENAIQLERSRPDKEDWVRTYWLVPGVGKVREEGERLEELMEYEVR